MKRSRPTPSRNRQQGYVLLSIMLFLTLLIIAMAVEAPRIAQQIKREREIELIHRGQEYSNAIKHFYHKTGTYPASIDQLEDFNRMRFLRKRYTDPMTGKADWRLLHPGEVQVNFSPATGGTGSSSTTNTTGSSSTTSSTGTTSNTSSTGISNAGSNPPDAPVSGGSGSPSTTQSPLSGTTTVGPIIGVASTSKAASIIELNGKTNYNDWVFFYDPRLEVQGGGTNPPGTGNTSNTSGQNSPPK